DRARRICHGRGSRPLDDGAQRRRAAPARVDRHTAALPREDRRARRGLRATAAPAGPASRAATGQQRARGGASMILLAFAGLFAGGIALVFDGLTASVSPPSVGPARRTWLASAADSLPHAGLEGVSVRSFILTSVASGLVAALAAQLILGWPALSVA